MSVGTQVITADISRGLPQYLLAFCSKVTRLGRNHFIVHDLPSYSTLYWALILRASLKNPNTNDSSSPLVFRSKFRLHCWCLIRVTSLVTPTLNDLIISNIWWRVHTMKLLSFYFRLSFLVWALLPTHCKSRGLLLHAITLNDTHSVGLLWTRDRTAAQTSSTWQNTTHTRRTSMPPAGLDPETPARERPQTHALARLPESAIKLLTMQLHMLYYSQQPTKKKNHAA